MMGTLRRRVPLGAGETPWSFASRLAAANATDLRRFLADVGLPLPGILNGQVDALAFMARLGCADPEALASGTFTKVEDGNYILGGQRMGVASMRRRRPWFCPLCACEDMHVAGDLPRREAVYCRAVWSVEHLRTCAVHGVALLDLARPNDSPDAYDFTTTFQNDIARLEELRDGLRPRGMSNLELYLSRRLESGSGGVPWLDGLAFNVTAMLAERVGVVAAFGQKTIMSSLTADDWWTAGDMGFAILEPGLEGLHSFLDRLQHDFDYGGSGVEKAHAVYGKLYSWLDEVARGPEYEPIQTAVRTHIVNRFPVEPGTRVLNVVVQERKVHSICSAAREIGRHAVRLRLLLAAEGLLPVGHESMDDSAVLFDAAAAAPVLARAADTMRASEVKSYLGVLSVPRLVRTGLIQPMVRTLRKREGQTEFLRTEIVDLMQGLTRNAVTVEPGSDKFSDIYSVARRTRRSIPEVVRLIREGTFACVGVLGGQVRFDSIVVRSQEVQPLIRSDDVVGLTRSKLVKELQVGRQTVDHLIRSGILPTKRIRSPFGRHTVDVVPLDDVAAFKARYVPLVVLARERRVFPYRFKEILSAQGIEPALGAEQFGSNLYLRSSLI